MSSIQLIRNATIINENRIFKGSVIIDDCFIKEIIEGEETPQINEAFTEMTRRECGFYPELSTIRCIFVDPGLTH
jgi:dihydroorotase